VGWQFTQQGIPAGWKKKDGPASGMHIRMDQQTEEKEWASRLQKKSGLAGCELRQKFLFNRN